jgi:serine/threonine protein phosphatase PrpC
MPDNRDVKQEFGPDGQEDSPDSSIPSTFLAYVVGAGSDIGKKRWSNEDSLFAVSRSGNTPLAAAPYGLFVVADGMGGYQDGQEASSGAIQAIVDFLWSKIEQGSTLQPEACTALLAEAVQKANEAVNQQNIDLERRIGSHRMEDDGGLCTTLTAAMLVGSTAYIANVGDCRAYLYRVKAGLKKITTDHLLITRLVQERIFKPDDLYTHPHRYILERALGSQSSVGVDLFTMQLLPGDALLLCSGGLWKMVRDFRIAYVLRHILPDPSQTAKSLIQSALDAGGWDNVSVIVISMLKAQDETLVPGVQFFAMPHSLHIPQA